MSRSIIRGGAATFGLSLALALGAPASAAPATTGAAGLAAFQGLDAVQARYEGKKRKVKKRAYRSAGPRFAHDPRDTVGSVGHDGFGYGYNRFSGERYMSCVFDEGYGRVKPCDSGDGGGGGRN